MNYQTSFVELSQKTNVRSGSYDVPTQIQTPLRWENVPLFARSFTISDEHAVFTIAEF